MIKNLRLLRRGLEADVEIGADKHGSKTWVHVVIPLEEVAEPMEALCTIFTRVAIDLIDEAAVAKRVREQVNLIRQDVIKREKERLQSDAKSEAARLATDLRRDLEGTRRDNLSLTSKAERLQLELDDVRRLVVSLQRSLDYPAPTEGG